ncbi:23123_t:CDS:2 [Gigaspora rosea]|nr:23123_t:CDS:2 [Gigaspora rosea]
MKESLYYNANQSLIEEVELLADDEPAIIEDIEDEPDKVALCAKYLLENLEQSEIKEWISRNIRMDAANEHKHLGQCFANLQPFADDEVEEPINEEFINERMFYGKAWGIAQLLRTIRAKEKELIKTQEASTEASSDDNIVELMNLCRMTGKGRPKGTSHYSESTL